MTLEKVQKVLYLCGGEVSDTEEIGRSYFLQGPTIGCPVGLSFGANEDQRHVTGFHGG